MKVRVDSYAWLPKSELSASQVASLKSELTIVPRTMVPEEDVEPLRLYQDTPDELGVPREFFYKHRRAAHEIIPAWTEGRKDLYSPMGAFTGVLREEQEQAFQAITTRLADTSQGLGGIVRAVPGWGKCLAPHTPVMRHDGSVVRADAVVTGDLLMGPDSKPREVLSTTAGRGRLYRIVPEAGTPWVCNADHILTLVHAVTGQIVDVPIEVYLALPSWQKRNHLQFSPEHGVDFPEQKNPLPVNPYFVGAWLGDGTKAFRGAAVSDFLSQEQRLQLGAAVSNIFRYKIASREQRREFLAGFLDAGGHTNSGAVRRDFAEAVAFVARSLGIRADIHSKTIDGVKHWRVNVLGDLSQLPLRLSWGSNVLFDHKALSLRQSFTVEELPEGPYAGFTLAGDGRFLLGDFTVTHNTVAGLSLLAHYDVPSLILVHRGFLMDQWAERIGSFLPQAKVGRAQQSECSYEGASIVLGMVHSVASGGYPQEFYDWPGLVMVDENHRMGSRTWHPAPGLFRARYRIGITATPRRKDGAENAFYYHIGPILFSAKEQRLRPKVRRVWTNFKLFKTDKFNPNLAPRSLLLKFLLGSKIRNRTIALQLVEAVKANRKCLIVSEQLKHLSVLEDLFLKEWPLDQGFTPGIGYYVGGRSKEQLQEASKAQVIFATSQYSSEGLDIPSLDTLFLVSPLSDVEQVVGRILRPFDGKKDPIVVDFRDDEVRQFKRQGEKRDAYYDKVTA